MKVGLLLPGGQRGGGQGGCGEEGPGQGQIEGEDAQGPQDPGREAVGRARRLHPHPAGGQVGAHPLAPPPRPAPPGGRFADLHRAVSRGDTIQKTEFL